MSLTETQITILNGIQSKLIRGDIRDIAKATKKTRAYVSRVLSVSTDRWNIDIVSEAVRIIDQRAQGTKKLLKKVAA